MLRRQFLRFACVGVVGFLIDAGLLMLAVRVFHWGLYTGRAFSFLIAVTAAWGLNRTFAFNHAASRGRFVTLLEWLRYLLSNAVGGSVNLLAYAWLVDQAATARAHPTLGVAVGSLAGMLVNFALLKVFVFRGKGLSAPEVR